MSTQSLLRFLERMKEDLDSPSKDKRLTYNLRTHSFVYNEALFISEFLKEMKSKSIEDPELEAYVIRIAPDMTTALRTTLSNMNKVANGRQKISAAANFVEKGGDLSFVFTTDIRTGLTPNSWAQGQKDVFDKIKRSYHKAYSAFFHGVYGHLQKQTGEGANENQGAFEQAYASKGEGKKRLYKGRAMHSGHKMGQGVVETRVREAFDEHKKTVRQKNNERKCLAEDALLRDLEKLGIDLILMRNPETGVMEFEIAMEGASGNIARGAEMKAKLDTLRKRLGELLGQGDAIGKLYGELEGSDTLLRIDRKRVIKSIADRYKKNPNVTVKTEDTRVKLKTKTVSKKIKGANVVKGNRGDIGEPKLPAGRASSSGGEQPKFNIQNILGVINAQLQDRVGAKMGDPRLENRSGRFLESVRATDLSQTAQGHPSVGYTYARDPYEVFETGSGTRFSSAYRDPRVIIDRSIREIVSQFGLGRLYTRRQ